jgi:hypothetical protein
MLDAATAAIPPAQRTPPIITSVLARERVLNVMVFMVTSFQDVPTRIERDTVTESLLNLRDMRALESRANG